SLLQGPMGPRVHASFVVVATCLAFGCTKHSEAGLGTEDASRTGTRVSLALNWVPEPEFGGFYAARETGAYRRQGFDVDIRGGGAGVPVVQMVATGRADFGTAGGGEGGAGQGRGGENVAGCAAVQK